MQNHLQFTKALQLAADLHQHQRRKDGETPYISHLLAVSAIVMRFGGDDDEIIAALLHDAVEDQGGAVTLGMIEAQFGKRVAHIVQSCSDTDQQPKPPWKERKTAYLAHLRTTDASSLMVSAADKLHNALDSIITHDEIGTQLWTLFNAPREDTCWYYHELMVIYRERMESHPHLRPLLQQAVKTIEALLNLE